MVATGANGSSGDITLSGSGITGKNVTLAAAHDLNLTAATNNTEQKSSNKASGWSGGIHVAIGKDTGIGVQASGFMASGKENGKTTDYVNSRVNASNDLTLSSGNDTVLSGAQALGNRIVADVGHDLTMTSLQDTDDYQSKQQSASGGFSFTFGSMTGSAGLSLSQSKVNSEYASVGDQSGLFAGNGGYDIYVGNHTQLNGAVIASTAQSANNALSTGTLGWSDIDNHASYKASSSSISMGGGNEDNKMSGGAIPTSANTHGSASGTTRSAVADGTITVRSGQAQTQNVADLSRDTDNANGHIDKIFDKDKVANKLEFAQGMQELGQRVAGDVSSYQMQAAENETRERLLKANPQYAGYSNEALNTLIVNDPGYKAVAEKWGTGGSYSMAAAAVTGVLGGLGAGNLGAAAAGGMAPYIANKIKHATSTFVNGQEQTNVLANTMAHAVAGAVLAQLAGNSATAGAAGAAGGELMARAILSSMYPGKQASELTQDQKQIVSALGQLAAQLSAGLASGSVEGGIQGAVAGKNAVENNALGGKPGHDEDERKQERGDRSLKIIPINPMTPGIINADGEAQTNGMSKTSVPKIPPKLQEFTNPAQGPVIPQGWISKPGRTSGSTIYYPPNTNPGSPNSSYIRVMPPGATPVPGLENGYWISVKNGQPTNPATGGTGTRGETHVPLPANTMPPKR